MRSRRPTVRDLAGRLAQEGRCDADDPNIVARARRAVFPDHHRAAGRIALAGPRRRRRTWLAHRRPTAAHPTPVARPTSVPRTGAKKPVLRVRDPWPRRRPRFAPQPAGAFA